MPRDILNDGSFLNFAGELHHGAERAAAGERDILHRAGQHEQQIGVENAHRRAEYEERDADGQRRHQIRQKRHVVDVSRPLAAPVFADAVADQQADGARQQRAADRNNQRALERAPDGLVEKNAFLAIHAVFGDVFAGHPPLGRQVARDAVADEAVIAGVRQEGLDGEQDNRQNAREERGHAENGGDHIAADFAEIDQRNLAGFAGDGRVTLATGGRLLVDDQDQHAEENHDHRKDARLARALLAHLHILGTQGRQVQVMRHGVRAHRAGKDQQHRAQHGWLDQRQRHARENLEARRAHDGRGFFKVRVHVAENAADEDIRERRVVQRKHHHAGEHALAPPQRHADAEDGGQQAVGRARHKVGIKQILPDDGQRPLGHDIRENENRA